MYVLINDICEDLYRTDNTFNDIKEMFWYSAKIGVVGIGGPGGPVLGFVTVIVVGVCSCDSLLPHPHQTCNYDERPFCFYRFR